MTVLAFSLVALLWSGSFVAIERVIAHMGPLTAAMIRIAVALPCLVLMAKSTRQRFAVPKPLRMRVWITGLFSLGIPFSLLFYGEKTTSPGVAGILNGTVTLWAYIIGALFFRSSEVLKLKSLPGILLGLVGVVLIFWNRIGGAQTQGALMILGMAISYGVGVHLNRGLSRSGIPISRFSNLIQQHLSAGIYLLLLACIFESPPPLEAFAARDVQIGILYLGIGSTAIAFALFYFTIDSWGAVRAATVTYIVPVLAVVWDYLLNGRVLEPHAIGGALLILAAVFWVQKT